MKQAIPLSGETSPHHTNGSSTERLRRPRTTPPGHHHRLWTTEFLAYFTTAGIGNGPTEAKNLLIKKIERVGGIPQL